MTQATLRLSYDDRPGSCIYYRAGQEGPLAQYSYDKEKWVDCRFITNADLEEAVAKGDIRKLMEGE